MGSTIANLIHSAHKSYGSRSIGSHVTESGDCDGRIVEDNGKVGIGTDYHSID